MKTSRIGAAFAGRSGLRNRFAAAAAELLLRILFMVEYRRRGRNYEWPTIRDGRAHARLGPR